MTPAAIQQVRVAMAGEPAEISPPFGTCPLPTSQHDRIMLGHGGGGQMTSDLLRSVFLPRLANPTLNAMEDQAVVALDGIAGTRIAMTTDSFVVRPLFFPGGDIGTLAVNGTVNDLAVGGARPLYLAASFILEEGLAIEDLKRVVASMHAAADAAGVMIVTGDTKVVERGTCDGMYITTTGVGVVPEGRSLSIHNAQAGDVIIVSGPVGDHGMAIMSVREGLEFETRLESDCASLARLVVAMFQACPGIRCMRDPTRGGLSSVLNELATASNVGIWIDEAAIPVRSETRAACEMLGFDPIYVACEGRLMAVAPSASADALLTAMRAHAQGREAAVIGRVNADHPGMVVMKSFVGGERIVTMLSGEQLPRIC